MEFDLVFTPSSGVENIGPFRKPPGAGPYNVTVSGVTVTFYDYLGFVYATISEPLNKGTDTWQKWDRPQIVVGTNTTTVYTYTKVSSTVTGFNGVAFPANGAATVFAANRFVVISDLDEITQTVSNAQTVNCGRVRLSSVRVIGDDGIVINTGYTADLEAGTVTFTNVTGYSQPVTIQHRVEDLALINEMSGNTLSLSRGLSHTYPVGSKVSSALVAGDMFARTNLVFDLASWNGTFSDTPGTEATGTFNFATYPIAVTNRGAITERWAIRFTTSTNFEVIGENVGVIATGNTSTNCAPINPNTSAPYFTAPALGWGSGWATGNVLPDQLQFMLQVGFDAFEIGERFSLETWQKASRQMSLAYQRGLFRRASEAEIWTERHTDAEPWLEQPHAG
jgi:hypothetical protein